MRLLKLSIVVAVAGLIFIKAGRTRPNGGVGSPVEPEVIEREVEFASAQLKAVRQEQSSGNFRTPETMQMIERLEAFIEDHKIIEHLNYENLAEEDRRQYLKLINTLGKLRYKLVQEEMLALNKSLGK